MRRIFPARVLIPLTSLFLLLVFSFNNCGQSTFENQSSGNRGGVVGNPSAPVQNKIILSVCATISRCHPQVEVDACLSGIANTPGINSPLGLSQEYSTPLAIAQGEQSGALVTDALAGDMCSDAIDSLNCDAPEVQSAYDPSLRDPYLAASAVIPAPKCNAVFSESQQNLCPLPKLVTYAVNDLGDGVDQTPGDRICATSSGKCTLRAALTEANADGTGSFDISLPPGTILINSPLSIATSISLFGSCAQPTIIDGQAKDSIFNLNATDISVAMHSLKLQNGNSAASGGAIDGGYNKNVTFRGSYLTFFNNKSNGSSGGSAVFWWGTGSSFQCSDCIFDTNIAVGTKTEGGAIALAGTGNIIERCLFVNNVGDSGASVGGVFDMSTSTTYINNTFYGNSGGAVYLNSIESTFILTNNTFVNNSSSSNAGGVEGSTGLRNVILTNNLFYNSAGLRGNCSDDNARSQGGNLSYPASNSCHLTQSTDILAAPLLSPLQDNGGVSKSILLLPGSRGVDEGIALDCPVIDQRKYTRPVHSGCDIGAVEVQ